MSLSNSALVGLKSVFDELESYPYGCTEQLTSRVLPLLLAPRLAEMQKVRLSARNGDAIDSMLGEIAKRQRHDGSLGSYDDQSPSSPWLSAYGMLALEVATRSGYFVPKSVRDSLASHLTRSLDRTLSRDRDRQDESDTDEDSSDSDAEPSRLDQGFTELRLGPLEQRRKELAQASFVADVLARVGQLDESRLRRLGSLRSEMALSSQIHVLHAMARLRLPRKDLDQGLRAILPHVTIGQAEARVDKEDPVLLDLLESKVRSTAILLEAVLAIDQNDTLASKLARGLLAMRRGSGYRNTQENAWALLALERYRQSERLPQKRFGVEVLWGDDTVSRHELGGATPRAEVATIAAESLLAHPDSALTLSLLDSGRLHYAVELRMAKDGASIHPIDEGMSVEKLIRAIAPNALQTEAKTIPERTGTEAHVGQLVLVDLLLESSEPREQLVVDDPMPAGFEAVEFGFDTTAQALSSAERAATDQKPGPGPALRYGNQVRLSNVHREMRDDRVQYFIPHIGPGIYHLRYLARASAAGRFVMPPTRAACMYDPDVFGQTKATTFAIVTPR